MSARVAALADDAGAEKSAAAAPRARDSLFERMVDAAWSARVVTDRSMDTPELTETVGAFLEREVDLRRDNFKPLLRAALEAMRLPTREMKLAANEVEVERAVERTGAELKTIEFRLTGYEAEDVWITMIDVLLAEAASAPLGRADETADAPPASSERSEASTP